MFCYVDFLLLFFFLTALFFVLKGPIYSHYSVDKRPVSHPVQVEMRTCTKGVQILQKANIIALTIHISPIVTNSFQHANIQNFFIPTNFSSQKNVNNDTRENAKGVRQAHHKSMTRSYFLAEVGDILLDDGVGGVDGFGALEVAEGFLVVSQEGIGDCQKIEGLYIGRK